MSTSRAIIVESKGNMLLQDVPVPDIPDGYILVQNKAVALNPTDWKHVYLEDCTGCTVGCDYAGVVENVGPMVSKAWKKGDRVAGFVHGCNLLQPRGGAFADYIVAKGDLQLRIPDFMSFEEAATLGVGLMTIGQNLYQSLQLPMPTQEENLTSHETDSSSDSILINGGATATGSLAIQFAKLSGLQVITTCSDANRPFVCNRGADMVFNYHDTNAGDQIREATDDALEIAFDTVSTTSSAGLCADAISSAGGSYNALLDVRCPRSDVDTEVSMAYGMIGDRYQMRGKTVDGKPDNFAYAAQWTKVVESVLHANQIRPHPFKLQSGGLAGIPKGLDLLRSGKVRAYKLVYRVEAE
ncbi:oxidoreductase [Penicillium nucicola]|uniref:oxidoreductase n=1 Tax=Penicillium nucicola TaxID=1850975 RepID=UPI00254579B6|nr:oxidoreductase [Penicillium nucicola]KAJ5757119.1 oxidoreductase [Penicillium nucicola]